MSVGAISSHAAAVPQVQRPQTPPPAPPPAHDADHDGDHGVEAGKQAGRGGKVNVVS